MLKRTTNIPMLDSMLLGGLPLGTITEIYGKAGIGKTSLSLILTEGYHTLYIDAEYCFSPSVSREIRRDLEKVTLARPRKPQDAKSLITEGVGHYQYIVLDSLAGVYESCEQIREFFSGVLPLVSKSGTSLIITNQIRNKVYFRGVSRLGHSGMYPLYDLMLSLDNKHKTKDGYQYDINLIKNKISPALNQTITYSWKQTEQL